MLESNAVRAIWSLFGALDENFDVSMPSGTTEVLKESESLLPQSELGELEILCELLQSDIEKKYCVGQRLENMLGVDFESAVLRDGELEWFSETASHRRQNFGERTDALIHLKHYLMLSKKNDFRGMNNIGIMYFTGTGIQMNKARGMQWLRSASNSGDIISRLNFSIGLYLYECEYEKDHLESFESLHSLVRNVQDRVAYNNLGCMLAQGLGCKKDFKAAMGLLERAVFIGSQVSKYNIGLLYLHGFGVSRSVIQGHKWIKSSREKAHHEDYKLISNHQDASKFIMHTSLRFHKLT